MIIKLGIFGATGRMGKAISDLAPQFPTLQLMGGTSRTTPQFSPKDLVYQADVLVDFSHPSSLEAHLEACKEAGKALLIGTTGLLEDHLQLVENASREIPIALAANTSIGIALLQHLVKIAAQHLDASYDIEIFETHHRQKIDAPSGTALSLGLAASQGRHIPHQPFIRKEGLRQKGEIGYASHRGGAIFGEHTVRFLGDEDVIELKHTALSRTLFARGALHIALKLAQKQPGLYTVNDLLTSA